MYAMQYIEHPKKKRKEKRGREKKKDKKVKSPI